MSILNNLQNLLYVFKSSIICFIMNNYICIDKLPKKSMLVTYHKHSYCIVENHYQN